MDNTFIYGKNSVIEALESNKREFNRILISNNSERSQKEYFGVMIKKWQINFSFA